MANLITTEEIPGAAVYGVGQVSYTVDGVKGKDYGAALAAAAFKESNAIENTMNSFAAIVRQRQRKLEDLGYVMAILNKAYSTLKTKEPESDDKSSADDALKTASSLAASYGVTISLSNGNKIRRDNVMRAQNQVQYAIDKEDNDLKQDMVSLQSIMSKRDNAFSNAARIIKKANNAEMSTIRNMGE